MVLPTDAKRPAVVAGMPEIGSNSRRSTGAAAAESALAAGERGTWQTEEKLAHERVFDAEFSITRVESSSRRVAAS